MSKKQTKDLLYALTKAGLASIPIAGAAASELLQLIIASPLEKRRTKWLTDIGEKLRKLEEENRITLTDLQTNESFIDIIIQTTSNVLKTRNKSKHEYYKNILINSVLKNDIDESETHIFINLIDTLTVWHIKILNLFHTPEEWLNIKSEKQVEYYKIGAYTKIIENNFPELIGKRDFSVLAFHDLERAGLLFKNQMTNIISPSGLINKRTTKMGERFLNFIKNN